MGDDPPAERLALSQRAARRRMRNAMRKRNGGAAQAKGGEIVASARLVERLDEPPPGERIELELKGKAEPVAAYRI